MIPLRPLTLAATWTRVESCCMSVPTPRRSTIPGPRMSSTGMRMLRVCKKRRRRLIRLILTLIMRPPSVSNAPPTALLRREHPLILS
ncbi:hypothetical protein BDW67DRAFT_168613 [Aspergillus spinulosporus]